MSLRPTRSSSHPSNTTAASNTYHSTILEEWGDTKRANHGDVASHGGEIGFDLAWTILFSQLFLNIKSQDTFLDLGGGRGNTAVICKLVCPNARAVSVEIDANRHQEAQAWTSRIAWKGGNTPELRNVSFLDDGLVEFYQQPRLKMWFNNFGMNMWSENGLQHRLENMLTRHCQPGTLVVSFDRMFMGNPGWAEEGFNTVAGAVDISWLTASHVIALYKYKRHQDIHNIPTTKRNCRRQLALISPSIVLGAAACGGTDWEEYYGKQTYPVKIVGNNIVQFMVEDPYQESRYGIDSAFQPETETHEGRLLFPIYKNGVFNGARYLRHVYQTFPNLACSSKAAQKQFLCRWIYFFNEMSRLSHGSHEHLKRSCSYVRPSLYLLSALTSLESRAIYEFGAGKGILFGLLKLFRSFRGYDTKYDVAVDSSNKIIHWVSFAQGELEELRGMGLVQYRDRKTELHTVADFKEHFLSWRCDIVEMNKKNLTPEILLIVWPNTDDQDFVNCVDGWYASGGGRLGLIYDPNDTEAFVPGPFLAHVPGTKWSLMENVLHDHEGGVKTYRSHMPLMSWGSSNQEIMQDANKGCSYGLYIYQRKEKRSQSIVHRNGRERRARREENGSH